MTMPSVPLKDVDPTLLWVLRRVGDEWGPSGVAEAAAQLANKIVINPVVLVNTLSWSPKTLIEKLSQQQTHAPDDYTRRAIGEMIGILQLHRPARSDGKHANLHTPTCGCDYSGHGDD